MHFIIVKVYVFDGLRDKEGDNRGRGTEEPRLKRMELALQDLARESTKNPDRHNDRVLHEVLEDLTVHNLDGPVIRGRCKEWECSTMVCN